MRFHKTLDAKFGRIQDKQSDIRKPAVSCSLKAFLENESTRIDNLIAKKKLAKQRLNQVQAENLSSRQSLREKIFQQQQKHEKKRQDFLTKRVKQQKFKNDEVKRKRAQFLQKMKEQRKSLDQKLKTYRATTIQFWNNKQQKTQKLYAIQSIQCPPLYEDALQRKKTIQKINQNHGDTHKDRFLAKHEAVKQRIQAIVREKQKKLNEYNLKLQNGFDKQLKLLQQKQKKYVNQICFYQDRSKSLKKSQQKEYQKKMKGKKIDDQQLFAKTRENFTQRSVKRAQSMKECRCHQRSSSQAGMAQSILLNAQDGKINSFTSKLRQSMFQKRKDFMMQSQTNLSTVKMNKEIMKQKQDINDEMKLMTEKEISEAVRTKQEIKNESNLMVRQARILA